MEESKVVRCKHPHAELRLNPSEKEGYPGLWHCPSCGVYLTSDPNNPKGVKYLDKPNPRQTKELPGFKQSKA